MIAQPLPVHKAERAIPAQAQALRCMLCTALQAAEVVDKCLAELLETVDSVNGRWLVTADHGNCDDMVQRTKKGEPIYDEGKPVPLTSHTLAPVMVAVGGKGLPETVQVRGTAFLARAEVLST